MKHRSTTIKIMRYVGLFVFLAAPLSAQESGTAAQVLDTYCISCHGPMKQQSGIRFDALETIDTVDLQALFLKAQEAVHTKQMPPAKAKQPTAAERKVLQDWLQEQLKGEAAEKLKEKLLRPEAGNYVDHDDLFSGKYAHLQGYTEDRRWLISQYIFEAKFNRILKHQPFVTIDGKRWNVVGSNNRSVSLTNPFLLPTNSGVRYYSNETLNGGHLLTMLTNARSASAAIMRLADRDKRFLPAVASILELESKNKLTLESRRKFLDTHIERVLQDLYGDKHQELLPRFVRVEVAPPISGEEATKKAPFHAANPGNAELELIFRTMRRHQKPNQTDAQLLEACEKEWFYFGHEVRTIQTRITFLNNYMVEWRQQINVHKMDERYKEVVFKPLPAEEMKIVAETIRRLRKPGDRYLDVVAKCTEEWAKGFEQQRIAAGSPPADQVRALVVQMFQLILERPPNSEESQEYTDLTQKYSQQLGRQPAIEKLIQTLILNTEFVYRSEFGQSTADQHDRRMMTPRDASYAIAYALTDSSPDAELAKAAAEGRLNTRADYEREVRRMLAKRDQVSIIDEAVNHQDCPNFTRMPIRELRFFRDFFGYPNLLAIFKDRKRFGAEYDQSRVRLVAETDMLVEHILEQDKDVLKTLLTTDRFYVYHSGDNVAMQEAADRIRRIYDHFKGEDWQNYTIEDLARHKDFIAREKMRGIDVNRLAKDRRYNPLQAFKTQMASFTLRLEHGQTAAAPYNSFPAHGMANASTRYGGRLHSPEVANFFDIDLKNWNYPTAQPTPIANRMGMLTHPAWLIAHAQNTETDPIHRGKWIREKLLAGTIPDVPITVDAVIPEDPHHTLRHRLEAKTNNQYCMSCHSKMNPLGVPFEIYDDFGRYRTQERLEYPENLIKKVEDKGPIESDLRDIYKTLPIDPSGYLEGTGDATLDGNVTDALDLIGRLAKSDRVRQSMIRHAFRYFMGRNETLSDSRTLIEADRAYLKSGGSFDALIVSLLTSDSFIYRKAPKPKE
ncbi:MAG: DUF1588 domain-containing protein [Zavarzinella sp.]